MQHHLSLTNDWKDAFAQLSLMPNAQLRGRLFEELCNRYFDAQGLLLHQNYTVSNTQQRGIAEQIDSILRIQGYIFLVEIKWRHLPIGITDISHHMHRLLSRSQAGGVFLSASGYTSAALAACRSILAQRVLILCDLQEILQLLDNEMSLQAFFQAKIEAAIIGRDPFFHPLS